MKRTKTLLSLALALVLVFSLSSGVFAAESFPPNSFSDVPRTAWYAEAVDFAEASGLMNGVADGIFDPRGNVTRAMVVTVLYRLGDTPDMTGKTNPFTDLTQDWYIDAVTWAADLGITDGKTETSFAPNDPITREQMATMILRFSLAATDMTEIDLPDVDEQQLVDALREEYLDGASVSSYARLAVLALKIVGVMEGGTEGTFRPQDTLSRAECAQTFLNLYRVE